MPKMINLTVDFASKALDHSTQIKVLIPQDDLDEKNVKPHRTLLLLHGLSDDHTQWGRFTSIERYAAELHYAVIMPNALKSWYTDAVIGDRYAEFIYNEVPAFCRMTFRMLSDKREDNFIAGLSMGGYGALKGALLYPERYAACACFSSGVDFLPRWREFGESSLNNLFGSPDEFEGSDNDVLSLISRTAASDKPKPRFYVSCGTEDWLLPDSRKIRDLLTENGYDMHYSESEGSHDWLFWDAEIQKAMKFFKKLPF